MLFYMQNAIKWESLGMVCFPEISALRRLRQEDYHECEASLVYIRSSMPA